MAADDALPSPAARNHRSDISRSSSAAASKFGAAPQHRRGAVRALASEARRIDHGGGAARHVGLTPAHEAAKDDLLTPSRLASGAIASAVVFCVPRHVAFADNAAMPIEACIGNR